MMKCDVRKPEDGLEYLVDCTLATVAEMAMKKSRSAYEFKRQKSMAQTGVDLVRAFCAKPTSRPGEVIEKHGGSVEAWVAEYDVKLKGAP